jgi:Flp pilus assembly protein TadD
MAKSARVGLIAASLSLAALAFVGLQGNRAVAASENAADRGDLARSAAAAHRAIRWAPWSARAWQLLGEAQLEQGDASAARRSFVTAVSKNDADWSIWLDLAVAGHGREQSRALVEAATLNPLGSEVGAYGAGAYHGKQGEVP